MKKTLENTFQKVKSRQQEKKKPKNPRSISRMGSLLGLGFGLIVSFNVGLYLYERNVEGVRLSRLEVLASQRAELAGEAAEAYIDNVWKTIEMYTSKPALNVAMAIGDINALENFKAEIGKRLHGVVAVRFIAAGEARLDQDVFPPIRFSELDMIRSALLREELYPEAAKINDRWVLTFVAPIPFDENQRAIGTMILTLFVDELQRLTLMEKASLGRLQLLQKFGAREALVVFSVGGGAEGREMVSPISNSYWHIGFKGSQGLKELARINLRNTGFAIIALMAVIVFVMAVAGRLLGIWLERSKEKAQMEAAGVPGQAAGDGSSLMDPLYQSVDILDIDIDQDNENLLGLDEVKTTKQEVLASLPDEPSEAEMLEDEGNVVPDVVFRAYDIRGLAKTQITKELARSVGQALGSEAIDSGQNCLIVARDARLSSPEITEWLIRGILNAGCNVLNIGTVPTPLLYFATCTLQESQSGVMVTASHSPAEHNGFKVVMNGEALS
ncbi:MAG: phosphomannomutase/phosphoglucomutase, partial [Lentisphaeria bacterium]